MNKQILELRFEYWNGSESVSLKTQFDQVREKRNAVDNVPNGNMWVVCERPEEILQEEFEFLNLFQQILKLFVDFAGQGCEISERAVESQLRTGANAAGIAGTSGHIDCDGDNGVLTQF